MIIDNSYFVGEIYIPHAKPSITDSVTGISTELINFIDEYERDALIKCLGYSLTEEFLSNLDKEKDSLIKDGADSKWNDLLNGKTYTDPNTDKTVRWKGIRFRLGDKTKTPYRSFLAYYVYFFYERDFYISRSNVGNQRESSKNSVSIAPNDKVVNAWNKFVELTQGKELQPEIVVSSFGYGVDYYVGAQDISLRKFILDSNVISENTYEDFNPTNFKKMNTLGL